MGHLVRALRVLASWCGMVVVVTAAPAQKIDRHALVTRHDPHLTKVDPWAPFSVGNGAFCFTADVTGLQTFEDHYRKHGIGLETQARWAWHSVPNPNGYSLADANRPFTAHGQTIGYPTNERSEAGRWLRENPHAMPLGQLAFVDESGAPLALADIANVDQRLDLWVGELRSRFAWRGQTVEVNTVVHPEVDEVAVSIRSAAVAAGKLRVRLAFPRGYDPRTKNNAPLDWTEPGAHATEIAATRETEAAHYSFVRRRDDFRCGVDLSVVGGLATAPTPSAPHTFVIRGTPDADALEVTVAYSRHGDAQQRFPFGEVRATARRHWEKFWQSGGAIEFAGSTDARARELERRVVLSQYLTAIQFAGDFPPSESGLTVSTWFQKHHTEMIWWHAAHFALWGRESLLAKNLDAYVRALPVARDIAQSRGLRGARWPKMVGPDWRESPGGNPLIVWNQPHPIHLAELLYRNAPTADTLAHYRTLVIETADGMASMLHWDEARRRYDLGPPLWIAQEIYDQATSVNPTYELSYWIRGLRIAQEWRERLHLGREPLWDRMIASLAALPTKDGKYVALESHPDTWENVASRHDHPSFLMALGQLPGDGVDRAVMKRTLEAVLTSWDWDTKIWGWDYPMVAMTAARVGEPKKAVDILLFDRGPNNAYTANGHCPQRGDLPVYLPANGALLAAVAMMAAGWDGSASPDAPGFPKDGTWIVHSEGLRPLP